MGNYLLKHLGQPSTLALHYGSDPPLEPGHMAEKVMNGVLPLFWAELETPFFANSPSFSTNRREAILSNLKHSPFSFTLHFLMFPHFPMLASSFI